MATYLDAFKQGVQAALAAEKNKSEIDKTFEELNAEIAPATENKVAIMRRKLRQMNDVNPFKAAFDTQPRFYWALVVDYLPVEGRYTQIAIWEMDPNGYPCKIELDSGTLWCSDKAGLEHGLRRLLSNPRVGEILYNYMRMPASIDESGQKT